MRMQALLSAGFAAAALVGASVPALAWTVYPDVDFEWYTNVGMGRNAAPAAEIAPAPRTGHIWVPGRYEARGTREAWVSGHWIKDDYEQQIVVYNSGNGNGITTVATSPSYETRTTTYATGPMTLRDRQGNIIPTDPAAYPIGYSGR
jgi:WXXGXW repeat (2 copies)